MVHLDAHCLFALDRRPRHVPQSELDFSYNYFSGSIPASFGGLRVLKALCVRLRFLCARVTPAECVARWCYSNNLSGTLPLSLSSLLELRTLHCSENNLSGVLDPSLGALQNLGHLCA